MYFYDSIIERTLLLTKEQLIRAPAWNWSCMQHGCLLSDMLHTISIKQLNDLKFIDTHILKQQLNLCISRINKLLRTLHSQCNSITGPWCENMFWVNSTKILCSDSHGASVFTSSGKHHGRYSERVISFDTVPIDTSNISMGMTIVIPNSTPRHSEIEFRSAGYSNGMTPNSNHWIKGELYWCNYFAGDWINMKTLLQVKIFVYKLFMCKQQLRQWLIIIFTWKKHGYEGMQVHIYVLKDKNYP